MFLKNRSLNASAERILVATVAEVGQDAPQRADDAGKHHAQLDEPVLHVVREDPQYSDRNQCYRPEESRQFEVCLVFLDRARHSEEPFVAGKNEQTNYTFL